MAHTTEKRFRSQEFDVLRTFIIISAFVIHFSSKYDLGIFSIPSIAFQRCLFTVGTFFFFTSGYMGHQIYLSRFKADGIKTAVKIAMKGFNILLLYIGYLIFMNLSTGKPFPPGWFDFLFRHEFFTIVLFTFAVVFIVSPLLIAIYSKQVRVFYVFVLSLYAIDCLVLLLFDGAPEISNEFLGIFFGVGERSIYYGYTIIPALITYCFGFLMSSFEDRKLWSNDNRLIWIGSVIVLFHLALVVLMAPYRNFMLSKAVFIVITQFFVFWSVILMRTLLSLEKVNRILTHQSFLLIGIKTLTFYVLSNLILGFLNFPQDASLLVRLAVFSMVLALAYTFTSWSFYADLYRKDRLKLP